MKETILETLNKMGFRPEAVDDDCYQFEFEAYSLLYMPSKDDKFVNICAPNVMSINTHTTEELIEAVEKVNQTLKYVKAFRPFEGNHLWITYEREIIDEDTDLETTLCHMIYRLDSAIRFVYTEFNNTGDMVSPSGEDGQAENDDEEN